MLSAINVIGDVTHMLELLLDELSPTLGSPADLKTSENDSGNINIFLYQVLESVHGKNGNWRSLPNGDQAYPPLQLRLYYLLTPYAGEALTEHHILGDALRILYGNTLIRGADLPDTLRAQVDQVAIVLMPLQLEELTRIWSALQSEYRLSVAYEVRVVPVQPEIRHTPSRVLTKVDLYGQRD